MAPRDFEELECERFLRTFETSDNPTWGFYVYGTYKRPQEGKETVSENSNAPEAAEDDAHFQAVVNKLHAHADDTLRYEYPAPYNQQFIDALRLDVGAYLPGASLADVCTHFREHYAVTTGVEFHDGPYQPTDDDEKCGPRYDWCLVVDDEAFQSLESGPEPIGPTPPENAEPFRLRRNASEVFVTLLSKDYTTMEKPVVLSAQGRGGTGRRTEWNGWLRFSIVHLNGAYAETYSGDPETYFESPDELVGF